MFQQNYFQIYIQQNFRSLSKIVLSMYLLLKLNNRNNFEYVHSNIIHFFLLVVRKLCDR